MRSKTILRIIGAFCLAMLLFVEVWAEDSSNSGHWVSTWSTAVHAPLPFPGLPPSPVFENQTIRMIVRPTIGGERRAHQVLECVRDHLAKNRVRACRACHRKRRRSCPESDHALTFGGKASVTVPPGAPILSDPIELKVLPLSELAVSLFLPDKTLRLPSISGDNTKATFQRPAISVAKQRCRTPRRNGSWYWLADVEVSASDQAGATVAFGDSITDGVGAKQGDYSDWPDLLANRVAGEKGAPRIGSRERRHRWESHSARRCWRKRAGTLRSRRPGTARGGEHDRAGRNQRHRLAAHEAKITQRHPVKEVPFARSGERARSHHGSAADHRTRTSAWDQGVRRHVDALRRRRLLQRGRGSYASGRKSMDSHHRAFDGVFDFDAAVRDPNHPSQFREGYHSGDHLHPSAIGYKAMADAVDLTMLRARDSSTEK